MLLEFRRVLFRSENLQRVLITTGGSDTCHVAFKFLEYIEQKYLLPMYGEQQKLGTLEFHVIVGRYNTDQERLNELSKKYPQIILHKNTKCMSEVMKYCDIAITAGGSTMYELCACGVPMITYAFANNQLPGVEGFEKLGVARYCGDIRQGELSLWNAIEDAIIEYSKNTQYRLQVVNKMHSLVDGNGAIRLAKLLVCNRY